MGISSRFLKYPVFFSRVVNLEICVEELQNPPCLPVVRICDYMIGGNLSLTCP